MVLPFAGTFRGRQSAAFAAYLARRYPEPGSRERAWRGSEAADPAEALAALSAEPERRWRDPRREAAALEALRFHGVAITDAIRFFCKIVKEASGGRLLTGEKRLMLPSGCACEPLWPPDGAACEGSTCRFTMKTFETRVLRIAAATRG